MFKRSLFTFVNLVGLILFSSQSQSKVTTIDKRFPPLEVRVEGLYNDDLNPTSEEEVEGEGVALKGEGKLVTSGEGFEFMLDYNASYELFRLESGNSLLKEEQSFTQYDVFMLSRFHIARGWFVDLEVNHKKEDQKFGTGISRFREGRLEVDVLTQNRAAIMLVSGNDLSKAHASVRLSSNENSYSEINPDAVLFNLSRRTAEFHVEYSSSPALKIIGDLLGSSDDYESEARSDSTVIVGLLGIGFELTSKSYVEALIGGFRREIKDKDVSTGLSWQFNYNYAPNDRFEIDLSSSRSSDTSEIDLARSSIVVRNSLSLSYWFNESLLFRSSAEFSDIELLYEDGSRDVDFSFLNTRLGYLIKPYSNVYLEWGIRDSSSNEQSLNYKQNEVRLGWRYEF
jgi:hypothetical protein